MYSLESTPSTLDDAWVSFLVTCNPSAMVSPLWRDALLRLFVVSCEEGFQYQEDCFAAGMPLYKGVTT